MTRSRLQTWLRAFRRLLGLLACAVVGLQLFFVLRIASMRWIDPQSTAFERSQAWQQVQATGGLRWRQQWRDYDQISVHLKRAVIASEDDSFSSHDGLDWAALEKAWAKNAKAEDRAAQRAAQNAATAAKNVRPPKVVGGSTITQQLAKNLFLSGERTLLRKGEELVLTLLLEQLLGKQRILEIYLNSVEWGQGVFGAEAAAQRYFRKSAAQLTPYEAARLVVMLPRPRYFEKLPNSEYLSARAQVIVTRMGDARLPGPPP
jgi:monofunctional biosynthetic peptidoglycan transglycosylase